jgi:hypothetical protein
MFQFVFTSVTAILLVSSCATQRVWIAPTDPRAGEFVLDAMKGAPEVTLKKPEIKATWVPNELKWPIAELLSPVKASRSRLSNFQGQIEVAKLQSLAVGDSLGLVTIDMHYINLNLVPCIRLNQLNAWP